MVNPEQLKVGLLVWWERRNAGVAWSCPCVVTAIMTQENHFRVRSLDDFIETDPIYIKRAPNTDVAALSEMKICSSADVTAYLHRQKSKFATAVADLERDTANAKLAAQSYATQADAFLATLS